LDSSLKETSSNIDEMAETEKLLGVIENIAMSSRGQGGAEVSDAYTLIAKGYRMLLNQNSKRQDVDAASQK
jgi:hypothetical protein